jgi:arylsulfatase A-like enzyme
MRIGFALALAAAGCALDPVSDALVFRGDRPRNLLLISADTLRRDAVSRYGDLGETPALDRFLDSSVALTDVSGCGTWTLAAFPCVFAGASPADLGLFARIQALDTAIPAEFDWGTSVFADAGYRTALVNANGILDSAVGPFLAAWDDTVSGPLDATDVTDAALETAGALVGSGSDWFLAVHYFDPHTPLTPPGNYLAGIESLAPAPGDPTADGFGADGAWDGWTEEERAAFLGEVRFRYAGEVRYWDDQFDRLLRSLDDGGALDDTLIVFWTDHGEQFMEHGGWNHGVSTHVEERAIVGGLWARGLEARDWDGPVEQRDLMPTAHAVLGLPGDARATGEVVGEADDDRVRLTTVGYPLGDGTFGTDIAAQVGRYVLRYDGLRRVELYDVGADPGETDDLWNVATSQMAEVHDAWEAIDAENLRLAVDFGAVRGEPPDELSGAR